MMNTFHKNHLIFVLLIARPFGSAAQYQNQEDDSDNDDQTWWKNYLIFGAVVICLIAINYHKNSNCWQEEKELRRQRQQQQRERTLEGVRSSSNLEAPPTRERSSAPPEENDATFRFEQFATKFFFQTISAENSNISAENMRNQSTDTETATTTTSPDEECPTEKSAAKSTKSESDTSKDSEEQSPSLRNVLLQQLASWIQGPCIEQECCICLEPYQQGDCVCAPLARKCSHYYHDHCIKEWIKDNDHCPLCRVKII